MTSEILIMTPSAIALSSDSVVTLENNKTYQGVNKLFMISNNPPMGMMIYNTSDFIGIPLESLISDFKEKTDFNKINTIKKIEKEFKDYLSIIQKQNPQNTSIEYKLECFKTDMINFFKYETINCALKSIKEESSEIPNDICSSFINDNLNDKQQIIKNYMKKLSNELFNNENQSNLFEKKFLIDFYLTSETGIVIAGFNVDELMPSYCELSLLHLYDMKFEFKRIKTVKLKPSEVEIVPFAQRDEKDTFLTGHNYQTDENIKIFMKSMLKIFSKALINSLEKTIKNDKLTIKIRETITDIVNKETVSEHMIDTYFQLEKEKSYNELKPYVGALPIEELSHFCESLIHITSLKRKVQEGLETVGGDIDVAIITKEDGFIWTKKKQYFNPEINHQFFKRKKNLNNIFNKNIGNNMGQVKTIKQIQREISFLPDKTYEELLESILEVRGPILEKLIGDIIEEHFKDYEYSED
ncbi:hypothetical protein [Methanobrevibacter sp. DSM 116169]|uniref:hypothetical protein n=1 Tax=Methanobrevibacter sp. DSM 116169 TaxID=3242727 RepID=UPI0038FC64DE